ERSAPNGIITSPYHFSNLAGRCFNLDLSNNGKITVGPVTKNKTPNNKATAHDRPAIKSAVKEPRIQAIKAPIVEIRKTGFPSPLNSLKFKFKLPSKRIIATATEMIGLYKLPKSSSGLIHPKIGPTSNPVTDMTTIAGIR